MKVEYAFMFNAATVDVVFLCNIHIHASQCFIVNFPIRKSTPPKTYKIIVSVMDPRSRPYHFSTHIYANNAKFK